ncbi:NADH kinase isoform X1 [Beta vulgaris subsp. vulgaris]|uniref:NADH kinase isoform X1 n=2 Tax=Beta vulgaris subsp. vulgaris TaxID=3555 RepID=UPI002036AE97|nr:NADH kinase isoform X1 [Beta vulgaris subsp. vulgaris]
MRAVVTASAVNWAKVIEPQKLETRMLLHGEIMARRKLLLLLKPFDVHPLRHSDSFSGISNSNIKILRHLDNRIQVHKDAISFCQEVLQRKSVEWETMVHNDLSRPIRDVDLVVTVGGDGTLLKASHFMDDSIPLVGVNSDPTQVDEVEQFRDEFDATRSAGYLCAASVQNFEQVLDEILNKRARPSQISRISIRVNSHLLHSHALNDLLIAHSCPATLSRFSFRLKGNGESCGSLVNCRSSGLRVSTAAGSTAAMLSAGGFVMPILSKDLQYMVREPILPRGASSGVMHGCVKSDQTMEIAWSTEDSFAYIDGSHAAHPIRTGDIIELSSKAPVLNIFLPPHFLSANEPAAKL